MTHANLLLTCYVYVIGGRGHEIQKASTSEGWPGSGLSDRACDCDCYGHIAGSLARTQILRWRPCSFARSRLLFVLNIVWWPYSKVHLYPHATAQITGSVSGAATLSNRGSQGYKMRAIISNAIITAIAFNTRSPIMSIAHLPLWIDGVEDSGVYVRWFIGQRHNSVLMHRRLVAKRA